MHKIKNLILENVEKVIARGPFKDNWESLSKYKIPKWYEEGKFGIFIHWGVYSVPAFANEWYPRNMYQEGTPEFIHHIKTYGSHNKFGYKDFISMFKAESFNPDFWAELFQKSGARFVVPVAEHHDGFQMYDSTLSMWNAARMGPKRDIIGELAGAMREKGLVSGLSSHRAEHYWFMDGGMKFDSDVRDPEYSDFYGPAKPAPQNWEDPEDGTADNEFLNDWLARSCELVDKYQPQIVWFDNWINNFAFKPYLKKFAAYYYNRAFEWNREVVINYKYNAYKEGTAVFDVERGQLSGIRPLFWQTDTAVSKNSWCYIREHDYKTVYDLICDLTDIVSKNGALLLNIGPRPDGTIPEQEQEMLMEIGRWLSVNGEAIYGTKPWRIFGEGPTEIRDGAFTDEKRKSFTSKDIRFTAKEDVVYVIILKWPEDGKSIIKSLGAGSEFALKNINKIELLGENEKVEWDCSIGGLAVDLSNCKPAKYAFVLRIT